MRKYKNRLRGLVDTKISFKRKSKLLVQRGAFIVSLLASVLLGVRGSLINNNNYKMALQRMILFPRELWENRSQQTPSPTVKKVLKCKKWTHALLHQDPYLKTEKQEPIPISK